jgi:choline dehydrogenase-like flavoprotein
MSQYMRKHQSFSPPSSTLDGNNMPYELAHHGTTGPVTTSFNDHLLPVETATIAALDAAAGYAAKPVDPWSGDHLGFFNTLGCVARDGEHKGRRSYAARGYLEPNRSRPNLKVLCSALVDKIHLSSASPPRAASLTFSHPASSSPLTVSVRKEIILCAGAIHSPPILERSGIGSPETLSAAGIPVLVPLPGVGNLLQDHVTSFVRYELKPGVETMDDLKSSSALAAAAAELESTGGGLLTRIQSCQGFAAFAALSPDSVTKVAESVRGGVTEKGEVGEFLSKQLGLVAKHVEDPKSATIQIIVFPVTADFERGIEDQSAFFTRALERGEGGGLTFAVIVSYPASRGSVHIKDSGEFE